MLKLKIVRETSSWVVVDKPAGFHTHPPEDRSVRILPRWNAQGILEKQLGTPVYPAHRLDRATSGLLLFSKDRAHNSALQKQFSSQETEKIYFALARGNFRSATQIDSPLKSESGSFLSALTRIDPAIHFTLPIAHPRLGSPREFTILQAQPVTGRFHQIRRHLAAAGFPILGDSRHGDKKLNREFYALSQRENLFLRCMVLSFNCPISGMRVVTTARWSREWHRLFELSGACPLTASPYRAPPSLS